MPARRQLSPGWYSEERTVLRSSILDESDSLRTEDRGCPSGFAQHGPWRKMESINPRGTQDWWVALQYETRGMMVMMMMMMFWCSDVLMFRCFDVLMDWRIDIWRQKYNEIQRNKEVPTEQKGQLGVAVSIVHSWSIFHLDHVRSLHVCPHSDAQTCANK